MSILHGRRASPALAGPLVETLARCSSAARGATSPAERRPTAAELAAMSDLQQSQTGLACTLFCVAAGTVLQQFGPYVFTFCMACGALISAVSHLLASLSALKTQQQARRHAEERHRAEMARLLTRGAADGGPV